jgi:transposase
MLVDTLGVLLTVVVTAARVPDRTAAQHLLSILRPRLSRRRLIWADQASTGDLIAWVWALRPGRNIRLEVVKRLEGLQGFHVLPKRWIVERTFAWLNRDRRFSKDDEYLTQTSATMIRVAMIHLMIRRLARTVPF